MSEVVVPQLGESVVEARVAKWLKKEGDRVSPGEPVVELETEKIDLEVGSETAGVLTAIKRQEGEDVKVGEVLAVVEVGERVPTDKAASKPSNAASTPTPAAPPQTAPPPVAEAARVGADVRASESAGKRVTPTARNVAQQHDVDLGNVVGTGPSGRVRKQDVERALAPASTPTAPEKSRAPQAPTAPSGAPTVSRPGERRDERVRMTKRRATIARRLVEAQRTAAMLTTFNEVDMTEVMALRERHKDEFKKRYGVGLGIASFFVKASLAALREFPRINAEVDGDEIVYHHYYDIGVAVGAEGGLVVPVMRDADRLTFVQIEHAIRDFARRAQDNTLTLDDLRGGTFTITNGGVFGSLMSTPILNPPQVGILGLHKIADRAVPISGQVQIRPMMYLALSYDHRLVDGREAVQFLVRVKECVEDPGQLVLES